MEYQLPREFKLKKKEEKKIDDALNYYGKRFGKGILIGIVILLFINLIGITSADFSYNNPSLPKLHQITQDNVTYNVNYTIGGNYLLKTGDIATGNYTFDTNLLFLDSSSNRVGIGTASPLTSLHIEGTKPILRLQDTDTGAANYITASSGVGGMAISADVGNDVAGSYVSFAVDGSHKMRVLANGRIGIGTTSPSRQLHIAGSGTSSIRLSDTGAGNDTQVNAITEYFRGLATSRVGWAGFGSSTNDDYTITNQITGGDIILMTNSGKVGIGTATPHATSKLHIVGNIIIPQESYLDFTGGVGDAYIFSNAEATLDFATYGGTIQMTIDSGGNVGIGTQTPQNTLNVIGNVNATGFIVNASVGYTGYCVNTTYLGGIAISCND